MVEHCVMRKQAAIVPTFPLHGSHVTYCTFSGCAREREIVNILLQSDQEVLPGHNDFY